MINIFKRRSSHSKEQDIDDSQNPWAGLTSYEDPETAERKLKFCGRDDDSYDLARLIMGNVFVTLYGKSGIGKTSLLNAGVFPELREKQYTPLSIRLGMRDEEHPQSYQTMITEAIERVVKRAEVINVIDEQNDQHSIDYLWNYFARHRFYDKYDEQTTPVVVFDQFEEVFRGHRNEAEALLRQLDYLNDKDHSLDNSDVNGQIYRYEQNFRFVVSIREDDLYRLEDSIDNCFLPALKRCRFRLRSLSEEGARDAILIPGEGLFNESEKDSIANAIIGKSSNDDGSISTNIISLLCSRIYIDFKRSSTNHITLALVENFIKGNPFERFYNEATQGFSNKEKSYIEEHFVDSNSRRNSIPESDFLLHVKNGAKLLEGKNRILQRVSTSSDGKSNRVELIHDSFCEPLSELKKKREQRRRATTYAVSAAVVFICLGVTALIFSQRDTISQREKELAQRNDSLQNTISQLEKEKLVSLNLFVRSKLIDGMIKFNCDKGVIYIVETKTGKIKAQASLLRCEPDYTSSAGFVQYVDTFQNERSAMLYAPTYLALLATEAIDSSYVLHTGFGIYDKDTRIKDHNWRRGGYGDINLARALEVRSEVALRMARDYVYGNDTIKFNNTISSYLGGRPDDLIGLLTFYNAVANNGCMVEIICDSEKTHIINPQFVPRKHIDVLQKTLGNCVSQGLSKKAGVSYSNISACGRSFMISDTTWRLELCGYLPQESPVYTLMVMLEKEGLPCSSGAMCGYVMKEAIDGICSILIQVDIEDEEGNIQRYYPNEFLRNLQIE